MADATDEPFLARWSRRKVQVRQETLPPALPAAEPAAAAVALDTATPPSPPAMPVEAPRHADAGGPPNPAPVQRPTLDEANALEPTSDFSRFVAPGVDAEVKNAAMKKLFSDPHYNVMDGLDTYIDDYGRADPIPKAMLRQLVQARLLGLLDDELDEQPASHGATAGAPSAAPDAADAVGAADAPEPDASAPPPQPLDTAPDGADGSLASAPHEPAADATPRPPPA